MALRARKGGEYYGVPRAAPGPRDDGARYEARSAPPLQHPPRPSRGDQAEVGLDRMPRALRSDASDAQRRRRTPRLLGAALGSSVLASLVLAPSAFANFITPKTGGSPNANQIHSLYLIILYIAAVVFVIVEGALVYSVYRFRAKKVRTAAQIHGNTRLEIGLDGRRGDDPRGPDRGHVRQAAEHHQPAQLERSVPRVVADRTDAAQRQEARDLRPGPAVHLAVRVRRRLRATTRSPRSCPTPTRRWSCRRAPSSCSASRRST